MNTRLSIRLAVIVVLMGATVWLWLSQAPKQSGKIPNPAAAPADPVTQPTSGQAISPSPSLAPAVPARPTGPETISSSAVMAGAPLVRSSPQPSETPAAKTVRREEDVTHPEARADLENIRFMFRDFRSRFGENPVGSNSEIMRAVMGGNAAQARLGPPEGQSLNERGELVDRWGTPYFFHQLSKTQMEIRSAGPDGVMWNGDDLTNQ